MIEFQPQRKRNAVTQLCKICDNFAFSNLIQ